MHAELLAQTHLIMLPLAALVLFLVVYFAVIARALFSSRTEIASAAQIPLLEEEDRHG